MKPISPTRFLKSRADLRREYATLARRLRNDPAAGDDKRLLERFHELGQLLKDTGGQAARKHSKMQAFYETVYEKVRPMMSASSAHSAALAAVRKSFPLSDRQIRRIISARAK
jgi:hypothetical protein